MAILAFLAALFVPESAFGQSRNVETLFLKEGDPAALHQTIEIIVVRHLPVPFADLNYFPLLEELRKRGYRAAAESPQIPVMGACTASTIGFGLMLWCTNFHNRPEVASILVYTPHAEHDGPESLLNEVHRYFQSLYHVQDT